MAKRGRPTKTDQLLRSIKSKPEERTPIMTDMYLPNLSGDHSAGKVLTTPTNPLDLVNKEYVDLVSVNTGIDLFGYNEESDIEGYLVMKPVIDGTAKESVNDTVPGDTLGYLVGSFITASDYDAAAEIKILTPGVYIMHAHFKASNAGRLKFYAEFYVRDSESTETLIGTTGITNFIGTSEEEHGFHFTVVDETFLNEGDRILVKAYANNYHPVGTDIDIYMEGETATRVTVKGISAPREHDSLAHLNWSDAGHTFDTDLDIGSNNFITTGTVTWSGGSSANANTAYTHSQIAGGNSVHVSTTENTQWDAAYTHSQDNTQAHSDYLLNSEADVGVGLTLTGDNSSADTAYVPMILYNTDANPPSASNFPIGTLYIQYTP